MQQISTEFLQETDSSKYLSDFGSIKKEKGNWFVLKPLGYYAFLNCQGYQISRPIIINGSIELVVN